MSWLRVLFHDFFCFAILIEFVIFFGVLCVFFLSLSRSLHSWFSIWFLDGAHTQFRSITDGQICTYTLARALNDQENHAAAKRNQFYSIEIYLSIESDLYLFYRSTWFFFTLKTKLIVWSIAVYSIRFTSMLSVAQCILFIRSFFHRCRF